MKEYPILFVIKGPIGVGKSSVAKLLTENIADATNIETDAIKRMIDAKASSKWRRDISHDTAAYLVDRLLQVGRNVVIEAHTKYPEEIQRYTDIAQKRKARYLGILLQAPLDICIQRAMNRHVPDIKYSIDSDMVTEYYCNLEPIFGDIVFDTSIQTTDHIVANIMKFNT